MRRTCMRPSLPIRAGGDLYKARGLGRSGYEQGPFRDLPDWKFADGRPAPVSPSVKASFRARAREADKIESLRSSFPTDSGGALLKMQRGAQGLRDKEVMLKKAAEEKALKDAKREKDLKKREERRQRSEAARQAREKLEERMG